MSDPARRPTPPVNEVFGDVLPDTTADERDQGSSDAHAQHDDWLRENRPPHHD
ncbi:hypothetical protein H7I41_14075 [Mycobacterium manitobense]|uniref:Uncharacterized protein n=1 Tax=[Mycobacterium] manitobense TaxID=190147 RepID=A0A9X2YQY9_9MYCO|nr:hypothetical protein [[Mycobacterium] manitobense]MCV7171042.1 hypothetical protein [[Mycobacterium] manitobense]